jgi:hypothetical protein
MSSRPLSVGAIAPMPAPFSEATFFRLALPSSSVRNLTTWQFQEYARR